MSTMPHPWLAIFALFVAAAGAASTGLLPPLTFPLLGIAFACLVLAAFLVVRARRFRALRS